MILLICRHYPSDSSNFLSSCSAIGSFGEYSRTDVKNFCASSFFPSFRFKYPRNSLKKLEFDPDPNCDCNPLISCAFEGDLDQDEIQLLALYMKHEWIKRCVASWENIRQLYAD